VWHESLYKGIIVGVLQCALVLSLTGKLFYDRATCPRVWVKTLPYDRICRSVAAIFHSSLAPDADASYFERTNRERVVFFVTERTTEADARRFGPARRRCGSK